METVLEIGEKIKRLRKANNLTQEELANRAYLTKGFISQLERDLTSPAIVTLKSILDVLGEELADFFRDIKHEKILFDKKARVLSSISTEQMEVELLVPSAQSRLMDPVLVSLEPGASTETQLGHEGDPCRPGRSPRAGAVRERELLVVQLDAVIAVAHDEVHELVDVGPAIGLVLQDGGHRQPARSVSD